MSSLDYSSNTGNSYMPGKCVEDSDQSDKQDCPGPCYILKKTIELYEVVIPTFINWSWKCIVIVVII